MVVAKLLRTFLYKTQLAFLLLVLVIIVFGQQSYAACGGTVRTWDGSSNQDWGTNNNWTPSNYPDSASEDALIVSAARPTKLSDDVTVGCVDITSGVLVSRNGTRTLSITGDYFKAPNLNSLDFNAGHNPVINMAGSSAQELQAVDPVNTVTINNNSTVTLSESFEIRTNLDLSGASGGTIVVAGDLTLSFTSAFTIPSGVTVQISNGASITAAGNVAVNGTLEIAAGGSLRMGSGTTLSIASTGFLNLNGASGNSATLKGNGSVSWNFTMAGTMSAQYFRVDRTTTNGINITGTVNSMDNGEFHYIASGGTAITLGASAVMPSTIDSMSFFDDDAYGNNTSFNVNASYSGNVAVENWAGLGCTVESCAYENDPNDYIDWAGTAATVLTLSTNNNTGAPANPVTAGAAASEFAIFSFALNQADTATDITSITFTLAGSGSASDVDYINVYLQGGSCQTRGTQVGGNITMSGSPATATVTFSPGDITVSDTSPVCVHVYLKTTSSAENDVTIGLEIKNTGDVTNSEGYAFSETSGPTVTAPLSTISGDPTRIWRGKTNTNWSTNANWLNGGYPTSSVNCRIGSGTNILVLNTNGACQNMTLVSGGEINFSTYSLSATGALTSESGFTFTNASARTLTMNGSSNQVLEMATTFPGHLVINNNGASSNTVTLSANSGFGGNLTVQDGELYINNGATLTIGGNVTVQSGAVLTVAGGGTLQLSDGATLTVNSGGTLNIVGSGSVATITAPASEGYEIIINGTVSAQNYLLSHLTGNGVTIGSGATIDASNYFQNGTFDYPADNNTTFLTLYSEIPGDALDSVAFQSGGSAATSITNIYTNVSGSSDTLDISNYTGDLAGDSYDNPVSYNINWASESNTYKITAEASAATSAGQGETISLGRFGFQQNAGSGFSDTNITSLKLTLNGTGSANDISAVRIYSDPSCTGSGGTQIGSGTFSGSPASKTFTGLSLTIPEGTSPAKVCIYVMADIASNAVNSNTVGVKIASSNDVVNSLAYPIDGTAAPPVSLGTATVVGTTTTWIGAVNSSWTNASNWAGGVPNSSLNCIIQNIGTAPVLSSGSATCKTLTINSGSLTLGSSTTLNLYGSLNNYATLTNQGTIILVDDGVTPTVQTITGSSSNIQNIQINKTAGGSVNLGSSSIYLNNLTLAGTNTGIFEVKGGKSLVLNNTLTVTGGRFEVKSSSNLKMGSGGSISVNGGDFYLNGTADAYPQNIATKAAITNQGSGTWSFSATSGNVYLSGFNIKNVNTSGINISGSTNLLALTGGQFTNLSNSYSSVRALQLNTTGSVPTTANNVGWNWSPDNTYPANTEAYYLIYTSGNGCGSSTIDFADWFGDWYDNTATFDISTKIAEVNCTINLNDSVSAVSLKSFTATAYDSKVDIQWETNIENDHLGFNIYRSDINGINFVQVNRELIRNFQTDNHGKYRIIDEGLDNQSTYYYYLEDIPITGSAEIHGPVYATPLTGLGNPPGTDTGTNEGDDGDDDISDTDDPANIFNPSYKDLGNGVVILSQTSSSLRLWVTPDTLSYTTSNWDSSYEDIDINGHSHSEEAGHPRLLERTILIEVHRYAETASVSDSTIDESFISGHKIAPAPSWQSSGGTLVANYTLDSTAYSTDAYSPNEYFEVKNNLLSFGDKKFLKVIIRPVKYNPVQEEIKRLDELIVDIGLDGNAWEIDPAEGNYQLAPESIANTLRIGFSSTGVYEVSYNDLYDSYVEGPFKNADVDDLRLYFWGEEIPVEITSVDSYFNSGDKLRFFVKYQDNREDKYNYVVLADQDLLASGENALRLSSLDGSTGLASYDNAYDTIPFNKRFEENNTDYFSSEPLGEGEDHFFWKQIFSPWYYSSADEWFEADVNLMSLDSSSSKNVQVKIGIKGKASGDISVDINHHLEIYVNNYSYPLDSIIFKDKEKLEISFSLPASYFTLGMNKIKLHVVGDQVAAGEYDIVLIDYLDITYQGFRYTEDDEIKFKNYSRDSLTSAYGFSSADILVYDITDIARVGLLSNTIISGPDSDSQYSVSFTANSGTDGDLAREYYIIEENQIKSVSLLSLSQGQDFDLLSTSNQADMLIIANTQNLIRAASDLIEAREDQGLTVKAVTVQDIYNSFNNGMASSNAIKEFIDYAYNNWSTPKLKYLMFIGDATYDPKDYQEWERTEVLMPMPSVKGLQYDFGSDNWFTTNYDDKYSIPRLAVGRIPSNDPYKVEEYFKKVLDYEAGSRAPGQAKKIAFIADSNSSNDPTENERFSEKATKLAGLNVLSSNHFSSSIVNRSEYSNANDVSNAFESNFNQAPLILNFIGHGAEDQMTDDDSIFTNSHARSLTNSKLPIFMALNCLNTNFYNADPDVITIGEELILNTAGGAITFIGSAAMTTPTAQANFAKAFYTELGEELGQGYKEIRIGDLFYQAKIAMGNSLYNKDVMASYMLFGDPSMQMPKAAFSDKADEARKQPKPKKSSSGKSGGGGCSAFAGDGSHQIPWYAGIMEYLSLFLLLILSRRIKL